MGKDKTRLKAYSATVYRQCACSQKNEDDGRDDFNLTIKNRIDQGTYMQGDHVT